MKRMRQSRTMWFSLALVIFGAIFDNISYLQNIIDQKYYGIILIFIGVVVAVLRYITSESVR